MACIIPKEPFFSTVASRQATDSASPRPVRLGLATVNGIWPFATHWAVQVQDTWFEVDASSKKATDSQMNVSVSQGKKSHMGADPGRYGHVGSTFKSDEEIGEFIGKWKERNPRYGFSRDNCQKFAREFIGWLTDESFDATVDKWQGFDATAALNIVLHYGCCRRMVLSKGSGGVMRGNSMEVLEEGWCCRRGHKPLPMMDAGVGGGRRHGPHYWSGAEAFDGNLQAYAGATVADMQCHKVLWNGELKGPTASVSTNLGSRGVGAFSEAEIGRSEGGVGPLRVALHCNFNTGLGFRNQGFEISGLGVGASIGANGISGSLPCLTIGLGQVNTASRS